MTAKVVPFFNGFIVELWKGQEMVTNKGNFTNLSKAEEVANRYNNAEVSK